MCQMADVVNFNFIVTNDVFYWKSDFNNLYILFHDAYRFVVIMISVHFKINDKSNLMTIILPSRS